MSGLLAEFADETGMSEAARRLRDGSIGRVETHTPTEPEHGERGSILPLIILVAGVLGAGGTFFLETYATVWSYPQNIGGRPDFSWPSYVPMAFEIGVLCAVAAGFFGFLIVNRLPALYDPVDELESFRRATRDGWFVAVRSEDGAAIGRARGVLGELSPLRVEEIPP